MANVCSFLSSFLPVETTYVASSYNKKGFDPCGKLGYQHPRRMLVLALSTSFAVLFYDCLHTCVGLPWAFILYSSPNNIDIFSPEPERFCVGPAKAQPKLGLGRAGPGFSRPNYKHTSSQGGGSFEQQAVQPGANNGQLFVTAEAGLAASLAATPKLLAAAGRLKAPNFARCP
jgi:hypothetical protein